MKKGTGGLCHTVYIGKLLEDLIKFAQSVDVD